jgi:hypothetical protein
MLENMYTSRRMCERQDIRQCVYVCVHGSQRDKTFIFRRRRDRQPSFGIGWTRKMKDDPGRRVGIGKKEKGR